MKRCLGFVGVGVAVLAWATMAQALDLADVPDSIRTELVAAAETMADGNFLIVGQLHFSDGRAVEGGVCAEAFVNYVGTIDKALTVTSDGWFYTQFPIDAYYAGGTLQIRALGQKPVDIPLTFDADILLIDDTILVPETAYTISGIVTNPAGEPEQGISIGLRFPLATNCWEPLLSMWTDASGRFSFDHLSSAAHRVALGAPIGYVYETIDVASSPTQTASEVSFVLQSKLQVVMDYWYQTDGSRSFDGDSVVSGSVTWPAEGLGFDFEDGHLEGYEADDLRDLDLIQEGGTLYLYCVYQNGTTGFYRSSESMIGSIASASEAGYTTDRTACQVGDVFVVRTSEGHYAKFAIQAIEEMPH